jgi:hypothetical protein
MTSMSSQSDGLALQSGLGRLTRNAVFCPESETVKKSLGNGDCRIPDTLKSGVTDGVGGGGWELLVPQPASKRMLPKQTTVFATAYRRLALIL